MGYMKICKRLTRCTVTDTFVDIGNPDDKLGRGWSGRR